MLSLFFSTQNPTEDKLKSSEVFRQEKNAYPGPLFFELARAGPLCYAVASATASFASFDPLECNALRYFCSSYGV